MFRVNIVLTKQGSTFQRGRPSMLTVLAKKVATFQRGFPMDVPSMLTV